LFAFWSKITLFILTGIFLFLLLIKIESNFNGLSKLNSSSKLTFLIISIFLFNKFMIFGKEIFISYLFSLLIALIIKLLLFMISLLPFKLAVMPLELKIKSKFKGIKFLLIIDIEHLNYKLVNMKKS